MPGTPEVLSKHRLNEKGWGEQSIKCDNMLLSKRNNTVCKCRRVANLLSKKSK
jgi:hypothetical protein